MLVRSSHRVVGPVVVTTTSIARLRIGFNTRLRIGFNMSRSPLGVVILSLPQHALPPSAVSVRDRFRPRPAE